MNEHIVGRLKTVKNEIDHIGQVEAESGEIIDMAVQFEIIHTKLEELKSDITRTFDVKYEEIM